MASQRQPPAPTVLSGSLGRFRSSGPYAGHLDDVSPHGIGGWVLRRSDPTGPVIVAAHLGGELISVARTGLARPDIEALSRTRAAPGFRLDMDAPWTRKRIIRALAKHPREASSNGSDAPAISMTVGVLETTSVDHGGAVIPAIFALPLGVPTSRQSDDWLSYFDIDRESLAHETEAATRWPPLTPVPEGEADAPRFIAFYLPQYHPIEQNDRWWGPGFTDWTGVATTERSFPSHDAPSVPADLGFYDLRVRETRSRQADLARDYGLYGFCYYFYWFSGQRLLEQPLTLLLSDGEPDIPFCLCWANEPWSRRWDGSETEVLMQQKHDLASDLAILDDLLPYFADERYIRLDGRPLLLIYRSSLLPDRAGFVQKLQERARANGLPGLFLCNVMSFGEQDASADGFDAAVEFPPHSIPVEQVDATTFGASPDFRGRIFDYEDLVARVIASRPHDFPYFPGVMPRWDNSPRRKGTADIFHGATPELFEIWLRETAKAALAKSPAAPLAFINSWNEWGEGAYLEPDRRYGRRYLEAVRRVACDSVAEESREGAPLERRAAALALENRLLVTQLADSLLLMAPIPMRTMIPEFPEATVDSRVPGRAVVEFVNGRAGLGAVVAVRRASSLALSGWFCGDETLSGNQGGHGYVALQHVASERCYYGPVPSLTRRPDVAKALNVDEDRDHFGFAARYEVAAAQPGVYAIDFIDLLPGKTARVATTTLVELI